MFVNTPTDSKPMKYIIIPFIALGLLLSLAAGIEYKCEGQELFPTYYGSPFLFKQKSLGASMEYYYSISGLILNVLVWSFILFWIDKVVQYQIQKISKPKLFNISRKTIIVLLMAFTIFNIAIDSVMIGRGFKKGLNYWYWDVSKEAKEWGVTCKREFILF